MADNNALSDIRYKLFLRMQGELELTALTQAPDNPLELTAAEITKFAEYRSAWYDIATGDISELKINLTAETMVAGIPYPGLPDGWSFVTRNEGDLPPVLARNSILDDLAEAE